MKTFMSCFILLAFLNTPALAEGPPNQLKDIGVSFEIEKSSSGLFTYKYSVSNPASNNGDIFFIHVFLGQDAEKEANGTLKGLTKCTFSAEHSSKSIFESNAVTATGSMAPSGWSCGYGTLAGFTEASYGWAGDVPRMIHPGESLGGFALVSRGLPEIREMIAKPFLDMDKMPSESEGDVDIAKVWNDTLNWVGKTVGPKSPPKDFVAEDFLSHIISLKNEAAQLGWIKGSQLLNELDGHFDKAQKALGKKSQSQVKSELEKVISLTKKGKGKSGEMTAEAQALLRYNTEYFLENLSKKKNKKCDRDHDKKPGRHHDKDHGKHHEKGRDT
jgi:hypothetical protein